MAKSGDYFKSRHIQVQLDADNIAWLTFDQPDSSANVLTEQMFEELDAALDKVRQEPPKGLILQSNKKSGFIAGADIRAFARIDTDSKVRETIERGQSMFNRIESLPLTTLAIIHGYCLGGGLEMALACDYRIVINDRGNTRIGLPEVMLGIHPGFGGTVRLTRLIGPVQALPLMLTGRMIDARKAKQLGIVDESIPDRHSKSVARHFILKRPKQKRSLLLNHLANLAISRECLARLMLRKTALKVNAKHYPAPFALINLWRKSGDDEQAMLQGEMDSIVQLFKHPTTKRLVRVFLLREKLKNPGHRRVQPEFNHVHVIGAGIMGGDIAAWCALKGMRVTLQDRDPKYIAPAIQRAHALFTRKIRDKYARQAALDRLIPDHKGHGIEHADVVIEAIIENLEAKTALYADIESRLKPDAILATNTSSIPLETLSSKLESPARLIGLHFFNPVARMQLIEVVSSRITDEEQIQKGIAFSHAIERLPLPTTSKAGFLVNRVLLPYLLEAVELLSEGVPAKVIDDTAKHFGMPMGPIQLADTVGLDICLSVANILCAEFALTVPDKLQEMVDSGHLGVKTKRGFYRYKGKMPVCDDGNADCSVDSAEIENRLVLRLLNECVACLRERIVENAGLLDAGMIFGTGFAPFRGGPLHYLEDRGISELHTLLHEYNEKYGERFKPDAGWENLHELLGR